MIDELTEGSTIPIKVPTQFGNYKYVETIGHGTYAVVIKAVDESSDKFVACKVVSRKGLQKGRTMDSFERELRIIERLDHPNIVKVFNILYYTEIIIIVMEYCSNGDLYDFINRHSYIEEGESLSISKQILSALAYLHSRGIAHRDIKPENIVFDQDMNAKLIDFGFCRETESLLRTKCGSPYYIPPEVAAGVEYDGNQADMWSFGVVVYYLATGDLPWNETNEIAFIKNLISGNIRPQRIVRGALGEIINRTLVFYPQNRATADQLLGLRCFAPKPIPLMRSAVPFTMGVKCISSSTTSIKKNKFIVRPSLNKQNLSFHGKLVKSSTHLLI